MARPTLSTVILNWNRPHLLQVTVESYLATVSVPYTLTIVDNASSDSARAFIERICRDVPHHRAVFLPRNMGGEAINAGFEATLAPYLHVSENDIEYLPGWDVDLLGKFDTFPELWQLSPFAPAPRIGTGMVWQQHAARPVTRADRTIYLADMNITTTCLCRRAVWDEGFRWGSLPQEPGSPFLFPDDLAASAFVLDRERWVAWNDRYTVINWGHSVEEWQTNVQYYVLNYQAKPWLGEEGMRQRLLAHGYDLILDGHGDYRIVTREHGDGDGNEAGDTIRR